MAVAPPEVHTKQHLFH
jgi:hypothetical protein